MSGTQVAEFERLADSLKEKRLFQEGLDVCEKVLGYTNVASKYCRVKSLQMRLMLRWLSQKVIGANILTNHGTHRIFK